MTTLSGENSLGFLGPDHGNEIKPPDGASPETGIANMKRTWQRAWWEL